MKIDRSKVANRGDLLVLLAFIAMLLLVALVMLLAVYVDTFLAGFISATITWKWFDWIYKPIDRVAERLWSEESNNTQAASE